MTSRWLGRRSGRVVAAAILVLSCVGSNALANVRAAADIGLLELSPGWLLERYHGPVESVLLLKAQAARAEFGAEVTDNLGFTVGAMYLESWQIFLLSGFPVSARVYWDFTPNQLWVRSTAYVTATYHHTNVAVEPDPAGVPPFVSLGVGATYTWYAATFRAELTAIDLAYPALGLTLGVEIGGSYIFGPHHESDSEY